MDICLTAVKEKGKTGSGISARTDLIRLLSLQRTYVRRDTGRTNCSNGQLLFELTGWKETQNSQSKKYETSSISANEIGILIRYFFKFWPKLIQIPFLAELYISLGDNDRWRDAVVRDERSFSVDLIKATHQVLSKSGIISTLYFFILNGFKKFPILDDKEPLSK